MDELRLNCYAGMLREGEEEGEIVARQLVRALN